MSASKVSYRVNKRFWPYLESLGFEKHAAPREWVRLTDDRVLWAVQMIRLNRHPSTSEALTPGSFYIQVGVQYEKQHLGYSIDEPKISSGIGGCSIRANLTRSAALSGPEWPYVWDPGHITPDEAITDAMDAFDSQAMPFLELWTDPQYAYDSLLAGGFPHQSEGAGTPGLAEVSVGPTQGSIADLYVLSELAFRLGRFEEEADYLERVIEQRGGGPAHTKRLETLRKGMG